MSSDHAHLSDSEADQSHLLEGNSAVERIALDFYL